MFLLKLSSNNPIQSAKVNFASLEKEKIKGNFLICGILSQGLFVFV